MRPLLSALVMVMVMVGCGLPPPASSTDLDSLARRSIGALYLSATRTELAFSPLEQRGPCPMLPARISAEVNGQPLDAVSLGSTSAEDGCVAPRFAAAHSLDAMLTGEITAFSVTDGPARAEVRLRNGRELRHLIRAQANGPVHLGETVTLGWSVTTDEVTWSSVQLCRDSGQTCSDALLTSAPGDAPRFVVQSGEGEVSVRAWVTRVRPQIIACTGFASCDVELQPEPEALTLSLRVVAR